ncbi:hypothetical protein ABW19_dt0210097 [Dactylella cylindrospora]|nr:hypothetical protein ABW19_dt0210097 [Dactylella cylindrospora]
MTDTLQIGDFTVGDFGIKGWTLGDSGPWPDGGVTAYIGLHQGSYFLEQLVHANVTSGPSWSFWGGWSSSSIVPNIEQDGHLIIGGYDEAKMAGATGSYGINEYGGCKLRVRVIGMSWLGETVTAIGSDTGFSPFEACVEPSDSLIRLPQPISQGAILHFHERASRNTTGFKQYTALPQNTTIYGGGTRVDRGLLNEMLRIYGSDLDLVLRLGGTDGFSESMEIVIPGHQLFQPGRTIRELGYEIEGGLEDLDVLLITENDLDLSEEPSLGLPFLSAAILRADYETGYFYLSQAIDYIANTTNIQRITPYKCEGYYYEPEPPESISTGEIAGVSVGAACAITLTAIGFWYWRRKRVPDYKLPQMPELETSGCEILEKDGRGVIVPVHLISGNEVFHLASNEIYHIGDDYGARHQSQSGQSIEENPARPR